MRRRTSGSCTSTNVHGCWCAPEGAVFATAMASSTTCSGTGSVENMRTVRRSSIRWRNSRARANDSSAGMRDGR
nr:hypothetical protein GCM10020241_22050 [Streptoalloteichus tenebrarius]